MFPITHTVSIAHLTTAAGVDKHETSPSITGAQVTIVPAGPEILAIYPGQMSYQTYSMYVYQNIDIRNGDKVTSGSDSWIVRNAPAPYKAWGYEVTEVVLEKVWGS